MPYPPGFVRTFKGVLNSGLIRYGKLCVVFCSLIDSPVGDVNGVLCSLRVNLSSRRNDEDGNDTGDPSGDDILLYWKFRYFYRSSRLFFFSFFALSREKTGLTPMRYEIFANPDPVG